MPYAFASSDKNPPSVRGTSVGTRKDIRLRNTVCVKLYVIA